MSQINTNPSSLDFRDILEEVTGIVEAPKVPEILRKEHLHTYERLRKKPNLFRCTHPDCTHYSNRDLLLGKRARCPFCGNDYILTWQAMRRAKPHCDDCTKGGKKPKDLLTRVEEILRGD